MNILNVLNYSPEFGGGIAQHLSALGRIAKEKGNKLYLGFPKERSWQKDLMLYSDVIIIPEIENPLWSGYRDVIRELCKNKSIDIVHIHFTFAQVFALACSFKKWEIPTIYHWHNPPIALNSYLTPKKQFKGLLKRSFSGLVARITDQRIISTHISMSKEITDLLIKNKWTTEKKIKFLPNGISSQFIQNTVPKTKNNNIPIIGTVANFRPQKDHDTLLKAFRILIESGIRCQLWIVGDGPTRPKMERLAAEFGIQSSVRFLGTVLNPSEFYSRFDIFVLSTHYEGHPLAILEAMGFGLPIVATRISSIPEVITDEVNGLLFNPEDSTQLAQAIKKILLDDKVYSQLSEASIKTFKVQHSVDDWANQVLSTYDQVLKLKVDF
jgi:glycosyltransferase involved in cell wall biosynthesis